MLHLLPGEIVADIISHVLIRPSSSTYFSMKKLIQLKLGLQQLCIPYHGHITRPIPQ